MCVFLALGNLPLLENIDVEFNHLNGSLPAFMGSSTSLSSLRVNGNSLTGSLPLFLGPVSYINISSNFFVGTLCRFQTLNKLQVLSASDNCLEMEVSECLCGARNITTLVLNTIGIRCTRELGLDNFGKLPECI